jgi:hypothetical protein
MNRMWSRSACVPLIVFSILGGCGKEDERHRSRNDLFPVAPWNQWFVDRGDGSYTYQYVRRQARIHGNLYHELVAVTLRPGSTWPGAISRYSSSWYGVDEAGNVSKCYSVGNHSVSEYLDLGSEDSIHESVWYRFDLPAGSSWVGRSKHPIIDNLTQEWNITLVSTSDTVVLSDSGVFSCYHFLFDSPNSADEEYEEWLAPGLGRVVSRALYWPSELRIVGAHIEK